MRYFASFRRADGSDYRVRLDGRWSTDRMVSEARKIAQRREHFETFKSYTIERDSAAGSPFARMLPRPLNYPIHV